VSFDPEPALASQGRDPPRDDHWRPVKRGLKMDGYFGLFSLNKHDFELFWNDGEGISSKNGVLPSGEALGFAIPGFCSCCFKKSLR
jgi:hypothetical protein